jgi:hypothetical protein
LRTADFVTISALGLTLAAQPGSAQDSKPARIRGYVVDLASPAQFSVEDHRLTDYRTYRVTLDDNVEDGARGAIRIGAELELDGIYNRAANEFQATAVQRRSPPDDHTPPALTISTAVPIEPAERKYWDWLRIEIKEPNFERRRSGGVTLRRTMHSEVIAKAEVQAYIADVGRRLLPAYQRDLPDEDPAKIPFKFYVVRDADFGASALPNGVVIVHSRVFEVLQNEAQLASIMAHEIAHVTQKHGWKLWNMVPGSRLFGYNRSYENQADRLGLLYMINAGYDPREATRTWGVIAKKQGFSPLRGSHENYAMRRAFMMSELEERFGHLDYSALTVGGAQFKRIAELLKKH